MLGSIVQHKRIDIEVHDKTIGFLAFSLITIGILHVKHSMPESFFRSKGVTLTCYR